MNRRKTSVSTSKMGITSRSKNIVIPCSTPENPRNDSPSRDSDSLCGTDAASPVPFLCTQDGVETETDVVWNYYTPKAEQTTTSRFKNSTPLRKKFKDLVNPNSIEKPLPKRKNVRPTQKNNQLFQDLIELNENIYQFMEKKPEKPIESPVHRYLINDEEKISSVNEFSPKSGLKSNSRCLRKNLLSAKFSKPDCETALESDDSMNEFLVTASQIVEENIRNYASTPPKEDHSCEQTNFNNISKLKMDQDSMDAILNSIKFESPIITKNKKLDSSALCNDSFDKYMNNLNDSALDRLTQGPAKSDAKILNNTNLKESEWTIKELEYHESPSLKVFGRHSSMPESPTVPQMIKPSTSGMAFGRYNSLPFSNNNDFTVTSPSRCTPDEIKRKHKQAREKLHAKRLLPFTIGSADSQDSQTVLNTSQPQKKRPQFQLKIPLANQNNAQVETNKKCNDKKDDLKLIIETKRKEALLKLRKRQQSKLIL